MTRTSVPRKAKQIIIAAIRVIAIFTIVQRRSSRCSRKGLDVSLSGNSRNLKISRSAILPVRQLNNSFREQTCPHAESVGVANCVVRYHGGDLRRRKFAAFQNHFRIIVSVMLDGALDGTGKKWKSARVGDPGRGKEIAEENCFAPGGELVTGLLAQLSQSNVPKRA